MSRELYARDWRVLVQRKGIPLDGVAPATVVTSPIRIQFTVTKTLAQHPNTLDLRITNLAESTRRQLKDRDALVRLEAGYADDWTTNGQGDRVLPTLFLGNARTVDHVREGPDWITHVQCGDGELTFVYAQISRTWAPGSTVGQVAADLAAALRDYNGDIDISGFLSQLGGGLVEGAATVLQHGKSILGNAMFELQALFPKHNVSVQNGELRVLRTPIGGATPGLSSAPVLLLSPETGLVGSPQHGTPEHTGLPTVLKAKSLLQPRLQPGDQVKLQSKQFSGAYQAMKVVHAGDSAGTTWYTDPELRPLQAS